MMFLFLKEHTILKLGGGLLAHSAKKPAIITRSRLTNDIFKIMSTTAGSLKSIPALAVKIRRATLTTLQSVPAFADQNNPSSTAT